MKTTHASILTLLIAALLIGISSCKNKVPELAIDTPVEGTSFSLTDSVHIKGSASDNGGLHELILIVTSMGDTVYAKYPDVHDQKNIGFNYYFKPASGGNYHLTVKATDHEATAVTAERNFTIVP